MKKRVLLYYACLGLVALLAAAPAHALSFPITFSEFPVGTLITTQYASLGVTFSGGTITTSFPEIANDGAMPTSPVLSPNPPFAGDFFMYFTQPTQFVTFISGFWDTAKSGVVQAFDINNNLLDTETNLGTGVQTFTFSGLGDIAYIRFNSNADPAGADIDNLVRAVPLPPSALLLGTGLLGLVGIRRFRKR